jgi:hypothetical protein
VVLGEGILFILREARLLKWETALAVTERIARLQRNYLKAGGRLQRAPHGAELDARFVLLHTFAHIMINRLAFECGYSSASLRERVYCSSDKQNSMAGVLIYTAVGDADGTMGGLVRMGNPGRIEPVVQRALETACWCSADPVCMEVGNDRGQGPCSCNLAACHNCALLPETSCESFNSFLDRGLLIGDRASSGLGFFEGMTSSPTMKEGQPPFSGTVATPSPTTK